MGAPAPQLPPRLYGAVRDSASDLNMEIDGAGRFSSDTPEDLLLATETFARYRLTTLPIIRQSDLLERRMFLQDIRELDRISFPEMQMTTQMMPHFSPHGGPFSRQREGPSFGVIIPRRSFADSLLTFPPSVLSSCPTI